MIILLLTLDGYRVMVLIRVYDFQPPAYHKWPNHGHIRFQHNLKSALLYYESLGKTYLHCASPRMHINVVTVRGTGTRWSAFFLLFAILHLHDFGIKSLGFKPQQFPSPQAQHLAAMPLRLKTAGEGCGGDALQLWWERG
jgi:hypothetical protein